jgi:dipeptidyl aminopeptidase/acylaminoacyl peptidase
LLNELTLGATEEIHYQAPDGWDVEGFVTLPPDFRKGRRYPAILKIHGGPVSQYNQGFSFGAQLLAAQGYVVIRTNPRGSSGYGQDFTLGLYQGWGEADYQDVLAGVDHVIELGYADPDRLGMGGYSYGGILTNYLLGQTDRFKAAASGAGSGHYLASYGHDIYRLWYETELGLPWETREHWDRLSPFNYIHKATTPTLFFGGEKDWNVPIQGSEQLYQVMKRIGVETQLVVYPGEHHGDWSYANEKDIWLRTQAWYDRFLKE